MTPDTAARYVYQRLLGYSRPYWGRLMIAVVASIVVAASDVSVARLVQPLVDKVIVSGNRTWMTFVPVVILAISAVKSVGRYLQEYYIKTAGQLVVQDVRNHFYRHSLALSMGYYSRSASGGLMSRILNDVNVMQRSTADVLVDGVRESFTLIGLVGLTFYTDWRLAVVAFMVLPVSLVPATAIGRKIKANTRRGQHALGDLTARLQETYSGIKVVKSFGREPFETARFEDENLGYYRFMRKVIKYDAATKPVVEMLGAFGIAGVAWYGLHRVFSGALTQGELFSFIAAMGMMYSPFKRLTRVNNQVQKSIGAAERVFEVLDVVPEVREAADAVDPGAVRGAVIFDHVTFAYEEKPVLRDFSLTVSPGEVIAVVGPSGAGKSTVLGLLSRFYDPQAGTITIDGIDIRRFSFAALSRNIAMVDQEVVLFHDTVMNNIRYGRPEAADEEVHRAAVQAYADDYIHRLPRGYDTVIGDRGVRLSGGQRQRLCIARAILHDAPILLLDEATSALDTESEAIVQQALANLMRGRTTFLVAHRLSTVRHAHRILVLDDGRLVEAGTRDELLAGGGLYRRLHDLQFENDDPAAQ
ncbi:MAG: ABC transporter ATP-binding protein [Deltaproteobacteria bacterium]|nr:ABC transporter ATP-binding protein [Candidatus Anaeroferrophillacea bacterium]